jgi:hypothetical protein
LEHASTHKFPGYSGRARFERAVLMAFK